jgi:hypothetical protein
MTTKGRTKVRCSSHCSTLLPFPLVSSGHPGNRSAAADVTPVTVGGKVFTFFVLIVGASQFQRGCLPLHCRTRVRGRAAALGAGGRIL